MALEWHCKWFWRTQEVSFIHHFCLISWEYQQDVSWWSEQRCVCFKKQDDWVPRQCISLLSWAHLWQHLDNPKVLLPALSPRAQHPLLFPSNPWHRRLLCGACEYLARSKLSFWTSCKFQAGLVHIHIQVYSLNVLFDRKIRHWKFYKKFFVVEKICVFLHWKDWLLKHWKCYLSSIPLLLHSCSHHLGFLSFQRDEETCPTLAPACSCTSGRPGLPGPPGPPVSSPFHMFLQSSIYCI